jgi:hypothetical protein
MKAFFKKLFCKEVETSVEEVKVSKLITPEQIINSWTDLIYEEVKRLSVTEALFTNNQIVVWLNNNFKKGTTIEQAIFWSNNLKSYLDTINVESKCAFFTNMSRSNQQNNIWPKIILSCNKSLASDFISCIRSWL